MWGIGTERDACLALAFPLQVSVRRGATRRVLQMLRARIVGQAAEHLHSAQVAGGLSVSA